MKNISPRENSMLLKEYFTKMVTYENRDFKLTEKMLENQLRFITIVLNIGIAHPEFYVDNMPILEFVTKYGSAFSSMAEQMIENNKNITSLFDEYAEVLK